MSTDIRARNDGTPDLRECTVDTHTFSNYSPSQPKKDRSNTVDFKIPKELQDYLDELDQFIEKEIMPIQNRDDNVRFFDHRREHSRTDWDNNGLPRKEWEALLAEARAVADKAGHLRFAWPKK